jgi:hypothetical protein
MRKFALFFMLALTAFAVMMLSEPVFAQEMADETTEETSDGMTTTEDAMNGETDDGMTTTEDAMDGEMSDDTTSDDTTDDSSADMAETTMLETRIDSPLKQMSMGVDVHQIQCGPEHKLVFKASNWYPACVKESSFQTLLAWGWIANHDPSDDELTTMLSDHMAKYPPQEDTEDDTSPEQDREAEMEENMDVDDDASSTNGTGTDQPAPQSHTINLSESMDMGAQ